MKRTGKIDIVVGGQYGDEGKGQVAVWLAEKNHYGFALRVGGYNAEHRFSHGHEHLTCRVLPCARVFPDIKLFLGGGHLFTLEALHAEAEGLNPKSIYIDENAGIVDKRHIKQSKGADRSKRGGTTGQGAGKAATHKVLRDGKFTIAKNYPTLRKKYNVVDMPQLIRDCLRGGENGILEGSQGALLSVNHGRYPFCCAKDVHPAGVLAETGAGIFDVGEVYTIYRAIPMRVPGRSGATGGEEMTWGELERRLGRKLPKEAKRQTLPDGTKGKLERIFVWSWTDFRKSLELCAPTKMVLTFADWLEPGNIEVTKWKDLGKEAKRRVSNMEDVARKVLGRHVPVVLVRTGEGEGDFVET